MLGQDGAQYQLRSAILHHGDSTMCGNHYTVIVMGPKQCWHMSDERRTVLTKWQALEKISKDGYLLTYALTSESPMKKKTRDSVTEPGPARRNLTEAPAISSRDGDSCDPKSKVKPAVSTVVPGPVSAQHTAKGPSGQVQKKGT